MRVKFFSVPALAGGEAEAEVNRFLAGHRLLAIDRQLVADGAASFWALSITYLDVRPGAVPAKRGKIDYREVLPEHEFKVYARLRSLRKETAEREGVPAYAVFTNEQLATMVRQRMRAASALAEIPGVGPARVERYGEAFLSLLGELLPGLDSGAGKGGAGA